MSLRISYKLLYTVLLTCTVLIFSACMPDAPSPVTGPVPERTRSLPSLAMPGGGQAGLDVDMFENEEGPFPVPILHTAIAGARGIYEPTTGIYRAMWLPEHVTIRSFNMQTGIPHTAFVREMSLDAEIPTTWILQNMATQSTPVIVLTPPHEVDDYTNIGDLITDIAIGLGSYNLPMFVVFYPPWSGHGLGAPDYAVIFRYARALFLAHAPLAAFVWVAPSTESTVRNPFFPGHDAVDWVGVSLLSRRSSDGLTDVIDNFIPFYHSFAPHHPIAILPLGVSHFSRYDHTYNVDCAVAKIGSVLQALQGFPRVGLVAYGDAFGLGHMPGARDDFSITIEAELLAAYRNAVSASHFIYSLEHTSSPKYIWQRSPFMGMAHGSNFYVPVETLQSLSISVPRNTTEIDGRMFVEMSRVRSAQFCNARRAVLIDAIVE